MDYLRLSGILLLTAVAVTSVRGQTPFGDPEILRVDLDLVLVPVSVRDTQGRLLTELGAADFRLWEDRVEQEIEYFARESTPASIGIVLDTSNSMNSTVDMARRSVRAFLDAGHVEDEYFLIEFSDQPQLREDFTFDISRLNRNVTSSAPDGKTALYDAVYRAISKAQDGQHARKALLIITDGEDNNSRYSRGNLENYVRESGIQIYVLGIGSSFGKGVLRDLAGLTGGTAVFADSDDNLEDIARSLAREITNQYVLGYVSTNDDRNGSWREIQVRVEGHGSRPAATAQTRRGYYARSY